jgi:15-cis-phytoene synthase
MWISTDQGPRGQSRPIRLTDPRISFAIPLPARDAVTSLWALDARLGDQLRATREPALAQIRLRWWRDALDQMESPGQAADPLLARLRFGWPDAAPLIALADVWEEWLCCEQDAAAAGEIAAQRGAILFAATVKAMAGAARRQADGGACWSLVDMALGCGDQTVARAMLDRAAAAQIADAAQHGSALAILDRWALRIARRRGAAAPLRDSARLFAWGLAAAVRTESP